MHARAARMLSERDVTDERIAAQIMKSEPSGEPVAHRTTASGRGSRARARRPRRRADLAHARACRVSAAGVRSEVAAGVGFGGAAARNAGGPGLISGTPSPALQQSALLATAARQLANAYSNAGNSDGALSALESAIATVETHDRELALILEAELAAKSQQAGDRARAVAATRLAKRRGLDGATPGERLVLASLAFEEARASESEREAVRCIDRGLAGGRWFDQQPDVVGPFYALVISLLETDALELAHTTLERALIDARARCSIPATAFLTAHRGWFHLRGGDLALAEADARTALDLLSAHDIRLGSRFALALLVEALVGKGHYRGRRGVRCARHAPGADIPAGLANSKLLEARGLLRIAQAEFAGRTGRPDRVRPA